MGQALIEAVLAFPDVVLAAALDVEGAPAAGRDAGERFGHTTGVTVRHDMTLGVARRRRPHRLHAPGRHAAHAQACARQALPW